MEKINNFFIDRNKKIIPRILTQICCDSSSELFGCCDRNFWHYNTTDFPSIILQQAIYTISKIDNSSALYNSSQFSELIEGGAIFWNKRAIRYRSFEEYYPYEKSFPALAFSSLSIAKLCYEKKIDLKIIEDGILKSISQLTNRFESKALNQQIAGITAAFYIKDLISTNKYDSLIYKLLDKTLDFQDDEGWFPEYGGPDLGYLSVSLDCLWDLYDLIKSEKVLSSINKINKFLIFKVPNTLNILPLYNSRNTNYILPYGLLKSLKLTDSYSDDLKNLLNLLFSQNSEKNHFIDSVDDRYLCHYIGQSFVRSENFLKTY